MLLSLHLLSRNKKIRIYKTTILPVILFGCETWSLTLSVEHRIRVFENRALSRRLRVFEDRVLNRILGLKRDEVMGYWRKLHTEELHNLYSWANIIRTVKSGMRWAGHVARMGEMNAYRILVDRPEGKRPLGRSRRRWMANIKIDLRETGWAGSM
jgi:hypothetical protein